MSWNLEQTKTNSNDGAGHTTLAATFDSAVQEGALLVVTLAWGQGVTTANLTVTSSPALTFTQDTNVNSTGDGYQLAVFHAYNVPAGSYTVTGNNNQTRTNSRIVLEEWSGAETSDPLDKTAGQRQASAGTGTDAVTSGNTAATTTNGQLVHGAVQNFLGTGISAGTGFTDASTALDSSGTRTEYLIQGSAGVTAATFTHTVAGQTYTIVTTYKAPATRPMFRGS
jgi:hypothetical protein